MSDKNNLPVRLERETIFKSDYMSLHIDRVQQPNGAIIERFHFVDYPRPAVGMVVENEQGEDALVSAQREVREETGFESTEHRLVYSYYPQQGSSNKQFQIVFCTAGKQIGQPDPDEISEVRWFTRQEVEGLLERQEMNDGLGLTALLLWLRQA